MPSPAQPSILRTLIIGGSGFIGQALLHALASDSNRKLTVLGRSTRPRHMLPPNVQYIQGDAGNTALMTRLLADADDVVDLAYATVPQTSYIDPLFDVQANLATTVHLLQLASKAKLHRYIVVSSGGTVYGNTTAESLTETHPTNPVSPYGISKLVTEKYAHFFHQMENLPVIVVRPGNPYGVLQVGQTVQGFIGASISAILANKAVTVYGARGTVRDYMHVDDLALGLRAVLQHGRPGCTYNLGSGHGHDNMQVLDLLRELAHRDGLVVQVLHQAERPFDVKRNVLDSALVLQHCGWHSQTSMHEGLSQVWHAARLLSPQQQTP